MKTVDQIADELLVSRNTVVKLIHTGLLTAIKVGDQYRIQEESFKRFISTATIEQTFKKTSQSNI